MHSAAQEFEALFEALFEQNINDLSLVRASKSFEASGRGVVVVFELKGINCS